MLAYGHAIRGDLCGAPASAVDYELVRAFVLSAEEADLFSESLTFEAKEKRSGSNVAEAPSRRPGRGPSPAHSPLRPWP